MNARLFVFFFIVLAFSSSFFVLVSSQGSDSCSTPLVLTGVNFPFNMSSLYCVAAWDSENFILRYGQSGPNTWNYLLSTPNTNAYVGVGFSPNGKMVGSTAIVGWVTTNGITTIKKYYLGGQSSRRVTVQTSNQGLQIGNYTTTLQSNQIYLAFQINTDSPSTQLIYAVGPAGKLPVDPDFRLAEHRAEISTNLNYTTGGLEAQNSDSDSDSLEKSHGILSMLGWAIMMPIGVMTARYLKKWDPFWFYAHVAIQSCGFIFGVIGIICGLILEDRDDVDIIGKHKALGIIILVLGGLQVMAILIRPDKTSKYRKYWNLYHHNIGRILVILAAANVFYGIHLADGGSSWNASFTIVLAVLFIVALILEFRMWSKN